jgi:hypothetical protein
MPDEHHFGATKKLSFYHLVAASTSNGKKFEDGQER